MLVDNNISINIESLVNNCASLCITPKSNEWFDNSDIGLYVCNNRVYTPSYINKGQFISTVVGTKKYIWDISYDNKYCIVLNDTFCIDCNQVPRCVASMIRTGTERYNCALAYSYNDDSVDVYVVATEPIYTGQELIIKYERLDDYC